MTEYAIGWLHDKVRELEAENKQLRAALEFYARPLNYDASPSIMVVTDGGDIARRALEPKP